MSHEWRNWYSTTTRNRWCFSNTFWYYFTKWYSYSFFDGLDDGTNNIFFPQKEISGSTYPLKEYVAIPIQISGLEVTSAGAANRPTLSVANIPVLSRSVANNSDGVDDENDILDILTSEGITNNEDL